MEGTRQYTALGVVIAMTHMQLVTGVVDLHMLHETLNTAQHRG